MVDLQEAKHRSRVNWIYHSAVSPGGGGADRSPHSSWVPGILLCLDPESSWTAASAFSAATKSTKFESDFIPWFLFTASKASNFLARSIFRPALLKGVNIIYSGLTYKTSFRWAQNLLFGGLPNVTSKYRSQFYTSSLWHRLLFR